MFSIRLGPQSPARDLGRRLRRVQTGTLPRQPWQPPQPIAVEVALVQRGSAPLPGQELGRLRSAEPADGHLAALPL